MRNYFQYECTHCIFVYYMFANTHALQYNINVDCGFQNLDFCITKCTPFFVIIIHFIVIKTLVLFVLTINVLKAVKILDSNINVFAILEILKTINKKHSFALFFQ